MKAKARLTIGGGRDFDNGRVSLPASEPERQLILYFDSPLLQRLTHTSCCQFRFRPRLRGGGNPDYRPLIFIIIEF
jgi:hypothetical protein